QSLTQLITDTGLSDRTLLDIPEDTTIEDALSLCARNQFLALPVYRIITGAGGAQEASKEYVAFVSLLDLLTYGFFKHVFDNMSLEDLGKEAEYRKHIEQQQSEFFKRPVKEVIGMTSESTRIHILKRSDSVAQLLQTLTSNSLHRVLVHNEISGELTVVSQSDVAKFLHLHRKSLAAAAPNLLTTTTASHLMQYSSTPQNRDPNQPVRTSSTTPVPITSMGTQPRGRPTYALHMPPTLPALAAFRVMFYHHVRAVAVVDEGGKFLGSISEADLTGIERFNIYAVLKPVLEFVETIEYGFTEKGAATGATEAGMGMKEGKPSRLHEEEMRKEMVRESASLEEVLEKMVRRRLHRVWVVDSDEARKLIGVVTLSDLVAYFAPGAGGEGGMGAAEE
ncbi:hypothetical protein HK102_006406, partial [Quaeritorhiza haematococci]